MGEDKQALEIYVFKIQDFAKAEEYAPVSHDKSLQALISWIAIATATTSHNVSRRRARPL